MAGVRISPCWRNSRWQPGKCNNKTISLEKRGGCSWQNQWVLQFLIILCDEWIFGYLLWVIKAQQLYVNCSFGRMCTHLQAHRHTTFDKYRYINPGSRTKPQCSKTLQHLLKSHCTIKLLLKKFPKLWLVPLSLQSVFLLISISFRWVPWHQYSGSTSKDGIAKTKPKNFFSPTVLKR